MKDIYTYIINFVIVVSFSCCNGYNTQQKLEMLQSSPINLNLENTLLNMDSQNNK